MTTNSWLADVQRGERPLYQAILRAMEAAIRSGALQPGDQLPPQRVVAQSLDVDITTVTRAYSAARDRGWISGAVGRGTFVTARALDDDPGLIDLSMNLPPPPAGVSLAALLRDTTSLVLQRNDAARLMAYHPGAGTLAQRAAGAAWLDPCLGPVAPDRVLVSSGAQTVLAALLSEIAPPGSCVVVEPLTYPGFLQAAARLGVTLVTCPVDGDGFQPEALARICRDAAPVAIYLTPTLQNPTATTMSLHRRVEVAEVATRAGVWIIEDDPYSRLLATPLPAIATLAPARTFYVATLAKCLSPGLRIAYLVCPEPQLADRLAAGLRALTLMAAPLSAAIVTSWLREGSAAQLLAAIRQEAIARRALAREILPEATASADESIHLWLQMPATSHPESLRRLGEARGLSLVTADSFAATADHPNGVRISLGGPETAAALGEALGRVAELVRHEAKPRAYVV